MNCEICGAETRQTYKVALEGTTMFVCKVCAKGKHATGRTESIDRAVGKGELITNVRPGGRF